jgi:drug/metabolite transporter (DMT)-like permease
MPPCPAAGSKETLLTYAALLPVAGGVVIATGAEPSFHILGFVACLLATAGRALKSVVQVSDLPYSNMRRQPQPAVITAVATAAAAVCVLEALAPATMDATAADQKHVWSSSWFAARLPPAVTPAYSPSHPAAPAATTAECREVFVSHNCVP